MYSIDPCVSLLEELEAFRAAQAGPVPRRILRALVELHQSVDVRPVLRVQELRVVVERPRLVGLVKQRRKGRGVGGAGRRRYGPSDDARDRDAVRHHAAPLVEDRPPREARDDETETALDEAGEGGGRRVGRDLGDVIHVVLAVG